MPKRGADFSYPSNVRFKCSRCTLCCGDTVTRRRHILVLTEEADAISRITSEPTSIFARKVIGHRPYAYEIRKTKKGKCVFLKIDACSIYASRPLVCRYYPFELRPKENGIYEFLASVECQGLGSGRSLDERYFSKLFQMARDRLKPCP